MKSNYILISLITLLINHALAQEKSKEEFNDVITLSTISPTINYAPRWKDT